MQDFKIDFVKRTIDILNKYNGEYPFSNLINCMLGLIILPFEKGNNIQVWEQLISEIEILKEVQINTFKPKYKNNDEPKSIINFLRRMRHGFAHQNIYPINDNQKFIKVQITNGINEHKDLDVIFTRDQLRNFALFIANTYLECLNPVAEPLALVNDIPKVENIN